MFVPRLFRRFASCFFAAALLFSCATDVFGQDAAAIEGLQSANARVNAAVRLGNVGVTVTQATLTARRDTLKEIMRNAPATARSYTLDAATRQAIVAVNPAYAALIEQDTTMTGQLLVAVADSFKTHSSYKMYSLHGFSSETSLSFASAPAKLQELEGRQVTLTGFGFTDLVVAESMRAASAAEVSAQPKPNASIARPAASNSNPPFLGPGITTTAPAKLLDIGPQGAAVIIVNFPSTPATANNAASSSPLILQAPFGTQAYWNQMINTGSIPNLSDYISETSYGEASISGDVYGPFTLPTALTCSQGSDIAQAAIVALGNTGVDLSKYNRFFIPFPTTSCGYDGLGVQPPLAATSQVNHEYTWLLLSFYPNETSADANAFAYKFLVTAHEFGHNLGLGHSNSLDFGATALGPIDFVAVNPGTVDGSAPSHTPEALPAATPTGSTSLTAINTEYGDPYPIMAGLGYTPYNAQHRYDILHWIGGDGEKDVTASGTFSVAPTENTTGVRSLHVLRDALSDSWVWVEFHQPNSSYTTFGITHEPSDSTLTTGAELLYSTSTLDFQHTYILDTTPTAKPNNFDDATLANGLSWSDPYSLLTITSGSQTSSALGVTVSYDTPCASVSLSAPIPAATAGTGTVNVSAPSGCSWTVSSNTSWISFPGTTSGTGPGNAPYAYTANTLASQRTGYITAQRQSLPLIQQGTSGTTAVGMTSGGTSVKPSTFAPVGFNTFDPSGGGNSTYYINISGFTPLSTPTSCRIGAEPQPGMGTTNFGIFDQSNGGSDSIIGQPGTVTIGSCTIDVGASTYVVSGNNATLTLSMSFPPTFFGNYQVLAGSQPNPTATVGYVDVNATGASAVAISPTNGTVGQTYPVTFTGTNSNFTAASTVSVSGTGVTVTGVQFQSATSLTGTLTAAAGTAPGVYTITVTSGTEVDTTTFTVAAAVTSLKLADQFSPTDIPLNGTSTLTFTITNPSTTAQSAIAFTDTLPAGLAGGSLTSNSCFGTATVSTASIVLSAGTLAGSSSCTVVATITGTASGAIENRVGAVSSSPGGTGNDYRSTLTVDQAAPALTLTAPAIGNRGTPTTLTATFTVAAGAPAPTASFSFYAGPSLIGTLAASQVSTTTYVVNLSSAALPSGTQSLTVQYPGDSNYAAVTSAPQTIYIIANNIWLADSNSTTAAMGATGIPYLGTAEPSGGTGVAIDASGNVWSINSGANGLSEFTNTGSVVSSSYMGGGLSTPTSLAIDGSGNVWITNSTNSVSVFANGGTPVSATAYTGGGMNAPSSISIDIAGNLWIANSGNSSITEVIGAAAPTVPLAVGVATNTTGGKP